jgi:hypothetical protein
MAKLATICMLLAVAAIAARKYKITQRTKVWNGAAEHKTPACMCHPTLCDNDRLKFHATFADAALPCK